MLLKTINQARKAKKELKERLFFILGVKLPVGISKNSKSFYLVICIYKNDFNEDLIKKIKKITEEYPAEIKVIDSIRPL